MRNNKHRATTAIIIDTRRVKLSGAFPVKLRVTFQRKQMYYSTGISLSHDDFEKAMNPRPRAMHKENSIYLQTIEKKAIDIIEAFPKEVIQSLSASHFFDLFKRHFQTLGSDVESIYSAFENRIAKLKRDGQAGTAMSYEYSLKSLKTITGKSQLSFSQIDTDFLKAYERKMIEKGKSLTTVSMYVRCIRFLFNDAIETGIVKHESYPFLKKRYQVPAVKGVKKALPLTDIQKLFQYEPTQGTTEQWALDMWLFSYLCNGINLRDIALLKFKNIEGDHITFIRKKTAHTSRKNLKNIVVNISTQIRAILDKWSSENTSPENYVFGILKPGLTPLEEVMKTKQATKTVNKYIKRIASQLEIDRKVTTYTARHSFATVLKRSGVPTEYISESLGHSNLVTTEIYLDSFDDDTRKKYSANLTNFSVQPAQNSPTSKHHHE